MQQHDEAVERAKILLVGEALVQLLRQSNRRHSGEEVAHEPHPHHPEHDEGEMRAFFDLIESMRDKCQLVPAGSIEEALRQLKQDRFAGVFSDAGDFRPLEKALLGQQASQILDTVGEGVAIVDSGGRSTWMNRKMRSWPGRIHEQVRRICGEAFKHFSSAAAQREASAASAAGTISRRYHINVDDEQFLELIASPVVAPNGEPVQVVAVVFDATGHRRLQQKLDAIDKAGAQLVRIESEAVESMNMAERLKLLEEKVISVTRDLMHFDHFQIRLIDPRSTRLELVVASGLPQEALDLELFSDTEANGISGYVARTGRSYICPDVERDPRFLPGLEGARSSLTVPLTLHDKIVGVFNIESRRTAAFTEDDRQFAEIFGRYVAIALSILNLIVTERAATNKKVADDVCAEVAGPLNDIALDAANLLDEFIGEEALRDKLQDILRNVDAIRGSLREAGKGPQTVLGTREVEAEPPPDPALAGARVLLVDDEPTIRDTIANVLRKYKMNVVVETNGQKAIDRLRQSVDAAPAFDLVLSDIKMPEKTGYDVFAAARRLPHPPPVILMTGFGYDPNHCIVRASQEGLQAVLFKPFRVESLLMEVRRALGRAVHA